ncbi:ferric uptake regulator, Fur family [Sulfobacillus acidophilus TPY]|uniref:Ferric uptake regulator, Fur family n=1 Tax=Sulfobacillus acidophilus (strain ATCC 700253 / DSM 10332 / NAL) TaxID=679936 RepID=G8TXV9_SULAD|nr:ferric uptake regulator, Fur family [Sulfobacillus acidophilus TPY]AEW06165.1 ferric uptake regulator, Fur family [Sulfobacillus acidophilus DSM 10332]
MAVDQLADLLRHHGLRATPQRLAVLEAVYRLSHPDADEVYRYVARRLPALSLATVYNTLDRLAEVGMISVVENRGRRFYDANRHHHDHMYCVRCGAFQDVPAAAFEPDAPSSAGWAILKRSIIWSGVCPACQGGAGA